MSLGERETDRHTFNPKLEMETVLPLKDLLKTILNFELEEPTKGI